MNPVLSFRSSIYRADFLRITTYGNAQFGVWVEK